MVSSVTVYVDAISNVLLQHPIELYYSPGQMNST